MLIDDRSINKSGDTSNANTQGGLGAGKVSQMHNENEPQRVFIAGINGFIGQALRVWLESQQVVVSGADKRLSKQMPRQHLMDLQDVNVLTEVLTSYQPHVIFHAVGAVGVTEPEILRHAHLVTTQVLLEAAQIASPRARIIIIGSAAEYGNRSLTTLPIEEGTAAWPDSDYGRSKLAQSELAHDLGMALGLEVIRVRLFNSLGPGQGTQLVAGAMVQRLRQTLLNREDVLDVFDPDSERDFLDVRDIARLVWVIANHVKHDPDRPPIHVASGEATSIKKLAASLVDCAEGAERVRLRLVPRGQPTACIGEPSTLRALSANIPIQTISLKESVCDMWHWELQQDTGKI